MIKNKKKKAKGFTLVELIVVIAIIGVLAVVLVPVLFNWINKSKQSAANTNAKNIYDSMELILMEYEVKDLSTIEKAAYDALPDTGFVHDPNPVDFNANYKDHIIFNVNTDIGGYINIYFKDGKLEAVGWSEDDNTDSDAIVGRFPEPIDYDDDLNWDDWYTP